MIERQIQGCFGHNNEIKSKPHSRPYWTVIVFLFGLCHTFASKLMYVNFNILVIIIEYKLPLFQHLQQAYNPLRVTLYNTGTSACHWLGYFDIYLTLFNKLMQFKVLK